TSPLSARLPSLSLRPPRAPPSFPPRRSSDLGGVPGSARRLRPPPGRTRRLRAPAGSSQDRLGPRRGEGPRRGSRPVRPHASHVRSEEHTSELQSPENLVCRELLEKQTIRVLG